MGRRGHGPNGRALAMPSRTPGEDLFRSLSTMGRSEGTHVGWLSKAIEAIRALATVHAEFTVEDLWSKVAKPERPALAGVAFREAAKLGYVSATGRYATSGQRDEAYAKRTRKVQFWESLI